MEVVQLTLMKAVYTNPKALQLALEQVQMVGGFTRLDTRYASRLGLLSGDLPEERIGNVEALAVVGALQRNQPMHALDSSAT